MVKVNLACGKRFHPDWINLDFYSNSKYIKPCNLIKKFPFKDGSVDVVYSSHFLEHMTSVQAKNFLTECYRILREGGIIRIVVPDLENIAKEYLHNLTNILSERGNKVSLLKYECVKHELLDQMVRNRPGGELINFYQNNRENEEIKQYVQKRTGENLDLYSFENKSIIQKLKTLTKGKVFNKMLYSYLRIIEFLIPKSLREFLFVKTTIGEKHLWMYDRFSLVMLLEDIGFKSVTIMDCKTSKIPDFEFYHLDINQDGTPYKGSASLYCEALK